MKTHWKILVWLLAGAVLGGVFQLVIDEEADPGIKVKDSAEGLVVARVDHEKSKLQSGMIIAAVTPGIERDPKNRVATPNAEAYLKAIAGVKNGNIVWHEVVGEKQPIPGTMKLRKDCDRDLAIRPFALVADIFMRLLKMLIVPIILTSIICGVIGVGTGSQLRRLGLKAFAYYFATSMLAIVTGLVLVNLIGPGRNATLALDPNAGLDDASSKSFVEVLIRMVPENVFKAFGDNVNMLQVIFFALIFGYCILKVKEPHRGVMTSFFTGAFEVMMRVAELVLSLIPYGAFCLMVKVVGQTGFGVFEPLAVYMVTVTLALFVHMLVTLPLVLRFVGRLNPFTWIRAMMPALLTAFSTSSSSMTLPVSMETVEKKGKVSNKVVSFVQPLGATINMDGTALYECIGVIFLAQYYASVDPTFVLTLADQIMVVMLALLASVGAAGIPSAGLIMMTVILTSLGLPTEGALLLLAVDRPLDMLRTVVNVFSDTSGAAIIARSEGERPVGSLGADPAGAG